MYVVSLTEDPSSVVGTRASAPLADAAFMHLVRVRPELRMDGTQASEAELAARLAAFWPGDEVVVYIGLAGTSLRTRVGQYYKTPPGAKKPHAGGWWLKTLTVLDELWVHDAATPDNDSAETAMLACFADELSGESRAGLYDPDDPAPFANLRTGRGSVKRHGIRSATGELESMARPAAPEASFAGIGTPEVAGSRPESSQRPTSPAPRSEPQRSTGTAASQDSATVTTARRRVGEVRGR